MHYKILIAFKPTYPFKGEVEGTQWGKPGPGGKYWRDSAISGQGFLDKMVNHIFFFRI